MTKTTDRPARKGYIVDRCDNFYEVVTVDGARHGGLFAFRNSAEEYAASLNITIEK